MMETIYRVCDEYSIAVSATKANSMVIEQALNIKLKSPHIINK